MGTAHQPKHSEAALARQKHNWWDHSRDVAALFETVVWPLRPERMHGVSTGRAHAHRSATIHTTSDGDFSQKNRYLLCDSLRACELASLRDVRVSPSRCADLIRRGDVASHLLNMRCHEGRVCPGSHVGYAGATFTARSPDPLLLCVATRDAAIDVQWRPYTITGETALGTRSIGGATGGIVTRRSFKQLYHYAKETLYSRAEPPSSERIVRNRLPARYPPFAKSRRWVGLRIWQTRL